MNERCTRCGQRWDATEEVERLRAALREIAECSRKIPRADGDFDMHWEAAKMHKIAREALEK